MDSSPYAKLHRDIWINKITVNKSLNMTLKIIKSVNNDGSALMYVYIVDECTYRQT